MLDSGRDRDGDEDTALRIRVGQTLRGKWKLDLLG
jgi:hypothetical protein